MMQEIEKKFLVHSMPDLTGATKILVRQGYLTVTGDSTQLRLRQKGDHYFLTLKGGEGLIRTERECEISQSQFDTFWPETDGRRLEKERWTGPLNDGHIFELDIFLGSLAPLKLVEVEFETEQLAHAFDPPDWFGADVTYDPRYKNSQLATQSRE